MERGLGAWFVTVFFLMAVPALSGAHDKKVKQTKPRSSEPALAGTVCNFTTTTTATKLMSFLGGSGKKVITDQQFYCKSASEARNICIAALRTSSKWRNHSCSCSQTTEKLSYHDDCLSHLQGRALERKWKRLVARSNEKKSARSPAASELAKE